MIQMTESFERVAVPMCAVNYHCRIVAWNRAAESFFGLAAEQVLGREWHSVIFTVGVPGCCALCRARRALHGGDTMSPMDVRVSVDGGHHSVTMLPVPMNWEGDESLSFAILPAGSSAPAVGPRMPIPINSRVVQLDDRIVENLTTREREVLACVVEGFDARTIAETVGITHATARNYVQRILTKLGARNKAEAVNVALRYNLIAS